MSGPSPRPLPPALLPLGSVVGCWRVLDWAGSGSHGAVYRATHVDKPDSAPVALKLALVPGNPRFAREAELLSRTRNPSVPRLWDSGEWQHPSGHLYPFLVMDWIDGVPLYAWARQHSPSPRQVLRLLAQLARALQSVHSHGSLHRDLKGDNVLVRRSDERAFLIDFGSGLFPQADTLTPPDMYPGTPAYRSPESGLFELQFLRQRSARYRAGPADELYALGVTACRLLTGEYPTFPDPFQDELGTWRMEAVQTPESLLQVDPPLRDLVLRMLSVRPEERGSVAQLAEDLEHAANAGMPALRPEDSSRQLAPASSNLPSVQARPWWPRLAAATSTLALAVSVVWALVGSGTEPPPAAPAAPTRAEQPDAGTAGLGEAAAPTTDVPQSPPQETVAEETPPEVLPDQLRPDANGHCPHKRQVSLNGGCWLPLEAEACEALDHTGHLFKGRCYVPVLSNPHHRPATSHPAPEP